MKRARGLVELSRRQFCAFAGAGASALVLGACDGGDAIQTGGLGDTVDAPRAPGDASSSPDASVSAVCSGAPVDAGAPSSFVLNTPLYNSTGKFFVVRDASGLFAVTARCTHENAICTVSSTRYRCPRHGALFMFDGAIISGPVSRPLVHFAMCMLDNGHVGVMTASIVPATTRLTA